MSTEISNSTISTDSIQSFTDWSWKQENPYDLSDEAILEHHGNEIYEPDSNNATVIFYHQINESSEKSKEYWKRLSLYNSGVQHRKWTNDPLLTYQVNRCSVEALMSQLNLTQKQRSRVYSYIMGLDLGKEGVRAELTMYCAIAAIVHQDETDINCHPNQKEIDKAFEQVLDGLELSDSEVQSHYNKHARNIRNENIEPSKNYKKFEKRKNVVPVSSETLGI